MKILASLGLFFGALNIFSLQIPFPQIPVLEKREVPAIISLPVRTGYQVASRPVIDTIVIHSSYNKTGGPVYSVDKLLAVYARYRVSAHYLIDREGRIYQLVPDTYISYHAGVSKMPDGRTSVNRFSLGIELMNTETDFYTEAQYRSLNGLLRILKARYPISHIVGHGKIAPTRKSDPWNFNWARIQDT